MEQVPGEIVGNHYIYSSAAVLCISMVTMYVP